MFVPVTNPGNKVRHFAYTDHGELERTWGDTTYPVRYVYDDFGRRVEMYTFRSGSAWDQSSWPNPEPSGDKTTWIYEEATGLLLKKLHADATEQNPSIAYTYSADGKLATRTWRRGVTTSYLYHDGTSGTLLTGELKSVSYSDSTPGVQYSYNRMGQFATVSDVLGEDSHVFTYNDKLQLETETIDVDGDTVFDRVITRKYWTGTYEGKNSGLQVGTAQDPDADYDVTYYYASLLGGRLVRVTGPGLPAYGAAYSTITDSHLMSKVDFKSDSSTVLATADWTYEFEAGQNPTHRNLIRSVENIIRATPDVQVSKYAYASDDVIRRTSVVYTGTAFAENHLFTWGYNDRGELTGANRYQGTDPDNPGTQYETNGAFEFEYDPIGNRVSYTLDGGTGTTYTRNSVNQYTETADPSQEFEYDEDGNLIEDGTYTYYWGGENRLILVGPSASPGSGDKLLEFMYDYMNRRIARTVYTHNGTTWVITECVYFIYDGWNVVLAINVFTEAAARKYTWGLDLSGLSGKDGPEGIHGAGGIGGLLAVEDVAAGGGASNSYWYLYDANGNVGQLLKASDRSLAAHYEYDPYGNVIASSGAYAAANPFHFSTKWHDAEFDLLYYGRRFLKLDLGRWLNHDPIEERGGSNLYVFVGNSPLNHVDPLGDKLGLNSGKVALKRGQDMLKTACDSACALPLSVCSKSKCRREAEKVVDALVNKWDKEWGWGQWDDNARTSTGEVSPTVGGWYCWDWANHFHDAMAAKTWDCFSYMRGRADGPPSSRGRVYVHYYLKVYACKRESDTYRVSFDDGFFDGRYAAHAGAFPNPADSTGYTDLPGAAAAHDQSRRRATRMPTGGGGAGCASGVVEAAGFSMAMLVVMQVSCFRRRRSD